MYNFDHQVLAHKLNRFRQQEIFRNRHQERFDNLTEREKEIMNLLAKGFNNPAIAKVLHISRFTVEQHRKNINRKLNISNYYELFEYALAFDLI